MTRKRLAAAVTALLTALGVSVALAPAAEAHVRTYPGIVFLDCQEPNVKITNITDDVGSLGRFVGGVDAYGTRAFGQGAESNTVFTQPYAVDHDRFYHVGSEVGHYPASGSPWNAKGIYRYHVQLKSVSGGAYPIHGQFSGSVWSDGGRIKFANGQGPWAYGALPAVAEWRKPYLVVSIVDPAGEEYLNQTPIGFHSGVLGPYSGC